MHYKLTKAEQERRTTLDADVKYWDDLGASARDIANELGVSVQAVVFSLKRIHNGTSMTRHTSAEQEAKIEAELLINAKMAPTVKPKAHKIMVNGWENGHYIHRQMVDVSEFWGLGGNG